LVTTREFSAEEPRPGVVIWITGLSGAGKSSVSRELADQLRAHGHNPVVLDGDEVRAVLGVTNGFDAASRRRLALTYGRLCRWLSEQGHVVVCATISLYREVHEWNRAHLARYVEVLLDVPVAELARRNSKGLYGTNSTARDVAGVDLAVDFPTTPDLVLPNAGAMTPESSARKIFDFCAGRDAW
jgi:adenylylsulfate kinase